MDLVFSTEALERAKRYAAWRDAICDVYVHVNVKADDPDNYDGFIRETQFGNVAMTECMVSQQLISRRKTHLSKLDKDCYYVQFIQTGSVNVVQSGSSFHTSAGVGALFCASEPYDLQCIGKVRSYYLEIPRQAFGNRFANGQAPLSATMSTGRGLGRIAVEFCSMLASQGAGLNTNIRGRLGEELLDVLALAFDAADGDEPMSEQVVQKARLRSVKAWIEDHLCEPALSPEIIAKSNGISLRYLHALFRLEGQTVSNWIWNRRIELGHDLLLRWDHHSRSLTEIAYRVGFSSSSHFSTMFRRRFGIRPSDLTRGKAS